jgi:NitT/TauT family transport system substrate-binding protein
LTAVVALLLAACGSSSDDSSGSSNEIRFGDVGSSPTLMPFYVAMYEGFFKKAGLNVSVQKFTGGGSSSVAALATGAVDVAAGGPTNFIGSIAKTAISGKLFAELSGPHYDLLVSKGVTSISQLKGQKIGVSGGFSADEIFLMATLAHYGIKSDQVTFVTAGTPAARLSAISSGTIKGTAETDTQRGVEAQTGTILLKAEDNPVKVPGQTLWATDSFLKNHPDGLKKLLSAITSAIQWLKQPANKAAAVADCKKGVGATEATCEQTLASGIASSQSGGYTWSSTSALDRVGITQAVQVTGQVIPEAKHLTFDDVTDTSIAGTKP